MAIRERTEQKTSKGKILKRQNEMEEKAPQTPER